MFLGYFLNSRVQHIIINGIQGVLPLNLTSSLETLSLDFISTFSITQLPYNFTLSKEESSLSSYLCSVTEGEASWEGNPGNRDGVIDTYMYYFDYCCNNLRHFL